MKRLFGTLLALTAVLTAAAQSLPPRVEARIEPDSVAIGDRFRMIIEVERDLVQVTDFPTFSRAPQGGEFELTGESAVDTLARDGRRLRLRKVYEIQAFGEGRFNLGRAGVLYLDKNIVDTLYSADSLRVEVGTFAIDTLTQTIRDLKPQRTLPFRFAEVAGYLLRALAAAALLAAGAWFLVRRLSKRGRRLGDLFRPAPPVPPHVEAIRALEELHDQKLWQNNRHKVYYSGLTEILRRYLMRRYGIGAMEMTSDEILQAVRPLDLPRKSELDLASLLRTADLVKFAKAAPGGEENEESYLRAYYFVEETKPVEETAPRDAEEVLDTIRTDDHA